MKHELHQGRSPTCESNKRVGCPQVWFNNYLGGWRCRTRFHVQRVCLIVWNHSSQSSVHPCCCVNGSLSEISIVLFQKPVPAASSDANMHQRAVAESAAVPRSMYKPVETCCERLIQPWERHHNWRGFQHVLDR